MRSGRRRNGSRGGEAVLSGTEFEVMLQPSEATRFFRLVQGGESTTVVFQTSPAWGETGVSVNRESIFWFSSPLSPAAASTPGFLYAEHGGRRILSRTEVSSDGQKASLFFLEDLPANSQVRVTLVGDAIYDQVGKTIDGDADGVEGGDYTLLFSTAGTTALPNTAVIGHVYASELGQDGLNRPLENVIVTVDGAEETLRAVTDSTGFFRLQPAPVGRFFVHVDGRAAVGSDWPHGAYYPFVGKAWEGIAGATNTPAGGSGEIFLPLIQLELLQWYP